MIIAGLLESVDDWRAWDENGPDLEHLLYVGWSFAELFQNRCQYQYILSVAAASTSWSNFCHWYWSTTTFPPPRLVILSYDAGHTEPVFKCIILFVYYYTVSVTILLPHWRSTAYLALAWEQMQYDAQMTWLKVMAWLWAGHVLKSQEIWVSALNNVLSLPFKLIELLSKWSVVYLVQWN